MNSQNSNFNQGVEQGISRRDHAEDDDTIDLFALLNTLWRGKLFIFAAMAIASLVGIYFAYVASVPTYSSTAVVILETDKASPIDLEGVVGGLSGDSTEVKSEIEVLRARTLMARVVDRLDLINDPEFNASLQEAGLMDRVKRQIVGAILGGIGMIDETAAQPSAGSSLSEAENERRTRDRVISALLNKITIRNVTGSLVFQVTATSTSPTKSALLADTLVELYIINQIDVKFQAMEQATAFLSNRVAELKADLEMAEANIADFNANTDLVSLEIIKDAELELNGLRQRSDVARQTLSEFETLRAEFTDAISVEDKASVARDGRLDEMAASIANGAGSQDAFDRRYAVLQLRVEQNFESAAAQVSALASAERVLEDRIAFQSRDLIALQQLTREAEATRVLYEYFLTRLKEISAQQGIQQADSRILSSAVLPTRPTTPRKARILALSLILGALIGALLVILNDMRKKGFKTAEELEAHTGLSVLGQIPLIKGRGRQMIIDYLRKKPTSAAAEAVRDLRTSIMFSNIDNPPKVIVSTSSLPGEGKTTQSLALAQNLAAMDKKVLLVEGDIRRRTLNEYFSSVPEHGIVSVLLGDRPFSEVVFRDPVQNFDVLFGEESRLNAADIFSSAKFKEFVTECRALYDVIIIDTPPVLVVPDSRIIAQLADTILLSVKWDSTSQTQVDESLRLFRNAKLPISGLVLSQISAAGMRRYGYGDKYGAYGGYGNKYYTN